MPVLYITRVLKLPPETALQGGSTIQKIPEIKSSGGQATGRWRGERLAEQRQNEKYMQRDKQVRCFTGAENESMKAD
jgi:hypothetical protein